MDPSQGRAPKRIREIIKQGEQVPAIEQPSGVASYIKKRVAPTARRVGVDNIVTSHQVALRISRTA